MLFFIYCGMMIFFRFIANLQEKKQPNSLQKPSKRGTFLSKNGEKRDRNCGQVKFFLADNETVIKKMQKKMGKMTFVLK